MSQFIEMYYNTHNKQTLESVCPIMNKGITPKYVESSSVLVINQACIHWDGQRLGNIKYHNEEIPVRKRILESGDVLLNATGNGTLGRCCVFICPSDNNTYINDGHVIALSTDRAVILPEVLNTYLSLNDTQAEIYRQYVTGSTNQVDIVFSDIKKMKVPVPSMDEQILFVEVLTQADKSKFGDFKSQFIEMFGNPVTNTKGWKTAKIKDVAPEMPSKEQLSGKIWLLNLDMIESNTGRIIEKVYEDVENALSVQSFDEGNVLFSKLRPYLNKVVIPDEPGMATTELVPLRPEPSKLHKVFLSHLLRGNQFVNYANDIAGGTKMPRMPLTELRNFDCILPPMDKQLEFVFIAEQADKSKFGDFKSQFIEMFGNPFEINSEVVPLSSLCSINPSKPKGLDDSLSVSFIPMDRISEDGEYAEFETKPLKDVKKGFTYCAEDDVLFAKITPCMENGKGAILKGLSNGIGFGSTEFHVLRPILGISNSEWLYFLTKLNGFRIDAAKNMTGTGGQKRVPSSYLLNFKVLKPQLEVQREFAKIVHQADKSKSVIQKALVYLNDIQSDELGKIA